MTDRLTLRLWNPQQGHQELLRGWDWCKSMLMAGHRLVIELRTESKSREQEKMYHAQIGEIAKQAQHLGATWDAESWKRLLLNKFAKDTNRPQGKIIPNLDGNGVVEVNIQSRKFTTADASEFVEWLYAWGSDNGVIFNAGIQARP